MSKFALGGILASAIAAMTLGAAPAQAALVDTSSICGPGTGNTTYPNGTSFGGLSASGIGNSWNKQDPNNAIPGQCGYGNLIPFRTITFTKTDGSAINGITFDVGNLAAQGNGAAGNLKAVFTTAIGVVTVFKQLDRLDGLEPFSYSGVFTSMALNIDAATSDASYVGFQAFHFNIDANAAPAVPEPATWAMLIGGFGLIGGAMRRSADRMPALNHRAV